MRTILWLVLAMATLGAVMANGEYGEYVNAAQYGHVHAIGPARPATPQK